MRAGSIMALDIGVNLGVAHGAPGAIPESYAVKLKKADQSPAVALANLVAFLQVSFTAQRPSLLVKEAPPPLQAFANMGNAETTVRLTLGLHAVAEAIAVRYGVSWQEVHDSTARKHFIGRGRMGTRKATKAAVVARCHALGYFGEGVKDDNRADACCVFDWASAELCRAPLARFAMFAPLDLGSAAA